MSCGSSRIERVQEVKKEHLAGMVAPLPYIATENEEFERLNACATSSGENGRTGEINNRGAHLRAAVAG